MKRRFQTVFVILSCCWLCPRMSELMAQESVPLPIRKVVLYKNGMGYFEHLGPIKGPQAVEISLPRAQMDDVLKSLTVIDLGGGQVAGVTYDSAAPLERRLGELPVDLSRTQSLVDFLNQVRGAEVKIQAPAGPVAGRLMGAELHQRSSGANTSIEVVQASVLSLSGEAQAGRGSRRLLRCSLPSRHSQAICSDTSICSAPEISATCASSGSRRSGRATGSCT